MSWYNPRTWFTEKVEPTPEPPAPPADDERIPGKLMAIHTGFEDDGRLRLEVEYDDVFVKSLRERGYIGTDDHQVVMKYIGDVYRTIISNSDGPTFD